MNGKALAIVNKLLEAEPDEFNPEQAKEYALTSRDYLLSKLPPEVASILEYAPDKFVDAFFDKREAHWEAEVVDNEWWATYDDDRPDSWTKYAYYSEYATKDGKLLQSIHDIDSDGDHDFMAEAEVGTPEWKEMLEPYAYYKLEEANAVYASWVYENGLDPLDFYFVAPQTVQREYIGAFVQHGDRAKFWKARQVGVEGGSPPASEDLASFPTDFQQYLNVDAEGINQDLSWTEMLELTQGTDPNKPELKETGGRQYIQFRIKFDDKQQATDHATQLKTIALRAAKQHRRAARSAKRKHTKNPHFVV